MDRTETPEQRQARVRAAQAVHAAIKATRENHAFIGGRIVRQEGLRVIHVPRVKSNYGPLGRNEGGLTVVYRYEDTEHPHKTRCMVQVAVAYQHPNDEYIKTEGRFHAASRFVAGDRITMRIPDQALEQVEEWLIHALGG